MKGLVVFYSRTGNTKKIAQDISNELNFDLEEIFDTKKRSGILGFIRAGWDAFKGNLTEIKDVEKDPGRYDLVIIGTPNWAKSMTPAIRTYIKQEKEKLDRTAFFCTEGGKGGEKLFENLAKHSETEPISTLEILKKELKKETYKEKLQKFVKEINSKSNQ
jgi:flavodoxin